MVPDTKAEAAHAPEPQTEASPPDTRRGPPRGHGGRGRSRGGRGRTRSVPRGEATTSRSDAQAPVRAPEPQSIEADVPMPRESRQPASPATIQKAIGEVNDI